MSSNSEKVKTQYTFALAIIIIGAYVVFFAVVMYQNPTNNYEGVKTITATFGVVVASVVGYYFGQKPAEAAQLRAEEARNTLKSDDKNTVEEIEKVKDRVTKLKVELLNLAQQLQSDQTT
jgi:Na+/glutamate symporter